MINVDPIDFLTPEITSLSMFQWLVPVRDEGALKIGYLGWKLVD